MSRLVINPGTPQAWEINLKPGANSFGRGDANDFKINDPSISGCHCQILVNDGAALLKDFGSTNGCFVGGARVQEQKLESGHAIRLGGVEMVYYSDAGGVPTMPAAPVRPAVRVSSPVPVAVPVAVRPVAVSVARAAPVAVASSEAPPLIEGGATTETGTEIITGSRFCKYHPKAPARYICPKCHRTFCELCINFTEMGNITARTCRMCGVEVAPYQFRAAPTKSFYAALPGAFGFPFKGAGIIIMVCATVAFAALGFLSAGWLGIFVKIALIGFVFLFMQNIILTTTSDEKAELCFPEISSLFGAAGQLVGTVIASFWLTIALEVASFEGVDIPSAAILASVILGGIYFPMALLAVAMKDTFMAANPLVVIPAMLKVPGKYAVTVALTLAVFGFRQLGDIISKYEGFVMLSTRNMNHFLNAVAFQSVWALLSVYLLCVTMRILGLFYNSSKQKLGWYSS